MYTSERSGEPHQLPTALNTQSAVASHFLCLNTSSLSSMLLTKPMFYLTGSNMCDLLKCHLSTCLPLSLKCNVKKVKEMRLWGDCKRMNCRNILMHGQDADIVCFFSNPHALLTQFSLDSMYRFWLQSPVL